MVAFSGVKMWMSFFRVRFSLLSIAQLQFRSKTSDEESGSTKSDKGEEKSKR